MTTRRDKLDLIVQRITETRTLLDADSIDGDAVEENLDRCSVELVEMMHEED